MRYSISGFIFAIEILNLKKYIGNCGFHKINWDDMSAEFGIVIGDKLLESRLWSTCIKS